MNIDLDRKIVSTCQKCIEYILKQNSFVCSNSHYFRVLYSNSNLYDGLDSDFSITNVETEHSEYSLSGEITLDDIPVEFYYPDKVITFSFRNNFISGPFEINLESPGDTSFFINGMCKTIYEINHEFDINLPLEYFRWTDEDITLMRMVCP